MAAAVRDGSPAPFGAELVGDALAGGEVAVQDPDLVSDGVIRDPSLELVITSSQCRGIVPRQRETSSSFKRILLRLGNKYNQSYEGKDKQQELTLGELAQAGCGVTESLASASGGVGGGWNGRRLKSIISTPQNLSCSDDV